MKCKHAETADLDVVCDLLAKEFSTEPVHKIIFPDSDTRIDKLRDFFRIYVKLASVRGGTLLTEDNSGAMVYFRPRGMEMTGEELATVDNQLRNVCGSNYEMALKLINGLDLYHPQTPPHYYISLLAVQREQRGGSAVGELFSAMNAMLDRDRAPCYAECTRFSTRTLIRRWGYLDVGSYLHIEGFPTLYPVWREPKLINN